MFTAKIQITAGFAAVCLILAGCTSSGLSLREGPGRDIGAYVNATQTFAPPAKTMAHDDGDDAQPAGANIPAQRGPIIRPARLAVAQLGEVTPPDDMIRTLESHKELFNSVQTINGITPPANSDRNWRAAEAAAVQDHLSSMLSLSRDLGTDYLLIYGGAVDTTNRGGPFSLLDLTIVGAYVIPSNKLDAEARASAVLLDTRTERPVAIASADAASKTFSPSVGLEGRQVEQVRRLRDETIDELTARILSRFESLE